MAKQTRFIWELRVAAVLIGASVGLYGLLFACFHDLRHIWLWALTSLAFLPLSVLVVTVFVDRLLSYRDRALRMDKLNMLIGAFFSTLGTSLLGRFAAWDPAVGELQAAFGRPEAWGPSFDERKARAQAARHSAELAPSREELAELRALLTARADFLIRLLENPNLSQHEEFSDLLRAVLHLAEELANRSDLSAIPDSDLRHLAADARRAYSLLVTEWVMYVAYLKDHFPYLFSLAVRLNPMDAAATPVVGKD
jgi:hypothetical protein